MASTAGRGAFEIGLETSLQVSCKGALWQWQRSCGCSDVEDRKKCFGYEVVNGFVLAFIRLTFHECWVGICLALRLGWSARQTRQNQCISCRSVVARWSWRLSVIIELPTIPGISRDSDTIDRIEAD